MENDAPPWRAMGREWDAMPWHRVPVGMQETVAKEAKVIARRDERMAGENGYAVQAGFLSRTQVVMERCSWTMVVLRGAAREAWRRRVWAERRAASTR